MRIVLLFLFNIICNTVFCQSNDDAFSPAYFTQLNSALYKIAVSDSSMETKARQTFQVLETTIKKYPKNEMDFALIRDAVNLNAVQLAQLIAMTDTSIYTSPYKPAADYTLRRVKLAETGKRFPPTTLYDTAKRPFMIDSLRGKVVLIDCWSSGCAPCRRQIPDLVKLYKKYQEKGFEILGFSLDSDKTYWLKAVAKDKQTWPQFCELVSWNNNKFATRFFISAIPDNFLIGKDGIILGQNLTPGQVEQLLKQQLN